MTLKKQEQVTEIFPSDSVEIERDKQTALTSLFAQGKQEEAMRYLLNVTSGLKSEGMHEIKFKLELHYLEQLSQTVFYSKTPYFFEEFLKEFVFQVNERFIDPTYRTTFCNFLFQQARTLGESVSKQSYLKAIELYNCVIDFFLIIGSPLANLITLKKGDLLAEKSQNEQALIAYKGILLNIYRLSVQQESESKNLLRQLLEALAKITSHPKEKNVEIYKKLLIALKSSNEDEIRSSILFIITNTLTAPDYDLYQHLFYVLSFLTSQTFEEQPPHLAQIFKFDNKLHSFMKFLSDERSIFKAIENKNLEKVQALIDAQVNLDVSIGSSGATPLQYAIRKGDKKIITLLIESGADTELTYHTSTSAPLPPPIYLAIASDDPDINTDIVKLLLERETNPNAPSNSPLPSPLYYAIRRKNNVISRILLQYGAELKSQEVNALNDIKSPYHSDYQELITKDPLSKLRLMKISSETFPIIQPLTETAKSFTKTAIFCPHALNGDARAYSTFAKKIHELDKDRPVYGIYAPEMLENESPKTIEEKAEYYIKAIKSIEPLGPYILFGWSFGGLLAYEIARRLINEREEVIIVGLFDTLAPVAMRKMSNSEYAEHLMSVMEKLSRFWTNVKYHRPTLEQLASLSKEEQIDRILPPLSAITSLIPNHESKKRMVNVIRTNLIAALKYSPPQEHEKIFVTCFNADASCKKYGDNSLGWNDQVGNNVYSNVIPNTNHFSILERDDLVTDIADFISNHKLVLLADLTKQLYLSYMAALHYRKAIENFQKQAKVLSNHTEFEAAFETRKLSQLVSKKEIKIPTVKGIKFFEKKSTNTLNTINTINTIPDNADENHRSGYY